MTTPARVLRLLFATVVIFLAGASAAVADTPNSAYWPDPHGRSVLGNLVFFGGITLGLYVLLVLLGLLTARKNYTPPAPGKEIHVVSEQTPAKH